MRPSKKEEAMKYMMLIHQGTTPLPGSDEWERLSEDERNSVYAAYKSVNETPGVTPGLGLQPPETATTVRVQDGKTLTTDGPFVEIKEAVGGDLVFRGENAHSALQLGSPYPRPCSGAPGEVGVSVRG